MRSARGHARAEQRVLLKRPPHASERHLQIVPRALIVAWGCCFISAVAAAFTQPRGLGGRSLSPRVMTKTFQKDKLAAVHTVYTVMDWSGAGSRGFVPTSPPQLAMCLGAGLFGKLPFPIQGRNAVPASVVQGALRSSQGGSALMGLLPGPQGGVE